MTLLGVDSVVQFPYRDNKIKSDNKDDVDYDVAARELAFEGKGAASDRTLTAEEASERDRQVRILCYNFAYVGFARCSTPVLSPRGFIRGWS